MEPTAVLYDDACNICKTITVALLTWDRRGRLRPVAIQSGEGQELLHAIPVHKRLASFHLAPPGAPVVSAGPALPRLFEMLPGGRVVARVLELSPRATSAGYDWVARNREGLSRFIPRALKARAARRLERRQAAER